MTQNSLRERNKQKVTERIIIVAVDLFKTRGYNQTTMDDIAEQAEISRKTLFNYFPSKESLLLPWGQEILDQYVQPAFQAYLDTQPQPTTLQAFHFLITSMGENIRTFPDAVQAFVREATQPHNELSMRIASMNFQEIFVQLLRYGQERGEVRTDIPLEQLARYLIALQTSLFFNLLHPVLEENQSQELAWLLAFVEPGLAPRP